MPSRNKNNFRMIRLQIQDSLFVHAKYSTDFQESKYIIWDRNIINNDLCFYTDSHIKNVNNNFRIKIGWLLESPEITKSSYQWIRNNYEKFDYVLTFDKELLDISDKFCFVPIGGCWIRENEQKIWNKTKNVSIIASGKNITIGHRLRHQIISNFRNDIDVYGRGYKSVDNKIEALKDYRFSIVIENVKKDYYFTEKLIDSFMTGTVPIYYGCPSISDFFDIRGIIIIGNINDYGKIKNTLNKETYENMKPYILENYKRAKEFLIAEDNIYKVLKNKKVF
jgi:hypothetical protein